MRFSPGERFSSGSGGFFLGEHGFQIGCQGEILVAHGMKSHGKGQIASGTQNSDPKLRNTRGLLQRIQGLQSTTVIDQSLTVQTMLTAGKIQSPAKMTQRSIFTVGTAFRLLLCQKFQRLGVTLPGGFVISATVQIPGVTDQQVDPFLPAKPSRSGFLQLVGDIQCFLATLCRLFRIFQQFEAIALIPANHNAL